MHEFAIAQSLCETVLDEARKNGATEVVSITCRFGVLRQIVPEVMKSAFELSAEGTLLERAELKFETDGMTIECRECAATQTVCDVPLQCPACGSSSIACSGGQDITLISIEINQGVDDGD